VIMMVVMMMIMMVMVVVMMVMSPSSHSLSPPGQWFLRAVLPGPGVVHLPVLLQLGPPQPRPARRRPLRDVQGDHEVRQGMMVTMMMMKKKKKKNQKRW
jgi:hypothetical protein